MTEINMGWIFLAFVTAIVGAVLLTNAATTVAPLTTPYTITNESISMVPARIAGSSNSINTTYNFTLGNSDWVANSVVATRANGTSYVEDTDYVVNESAKTLRFLNTTNVFTGGNLSGANYQAYDSNYVDDQGSRAVIPLIIIMMAIGIVLGVIAYLRRNTEEYF